MKKQNFIYPQFVSMGESNALRLKYDGHRYYYYRDGGDWFIGFKFNKDGSLVSSTTIVSLDNIKLTPITREEWENCNGCYTPTEFTIYGFEIGGKSSQTNKNKYLLIR